MKQILLILLILFALPHAAFAQEPSPATASTQLVKQKVQYDLPYPGILPDHFLYPVKAARDRVVIFLINDPLKKAEFLLHTSDKRLSAGIYLIEKDKDALATSTIAKSTNYMDGALQKAKEAKEMGSDTGGILTHMNTSIEKHQELIQNGKKQVEKKYQSELDAEYARLEQLQKEINSLLPKS